MRIAKFQATDMRDALAQVKRELGPDAVIVATKEVRRGLLATGVEVTAAIDFEDAAPTASSYGARGSAPTAPVLNDGDVERILAPLRSELRSLKTFLRPLAETRGDDGLRNELAALRQAIASLQQPGGGPNLAEPSIDEIAEHSALTAPSRGRIVAVVGPTGVGKTTTIAKLAARAALVEHRQVAIVTLDSYRVGGEEQIRAFADLMGVPLTLVADPTALRATVSSVDADLVYIDTAGRSPRDAGAVATLAQAFTGIEDLEIHLAVPAGAGERAITTCYARHRILGIDRLLFTKVDEAEELSELVRAPARLGKPVTWLTTGQRVPEDLEAATQERLIGLAKSGLAGHERDGIGAPLGASDTVRGGKGAAA
jgi:flagellar biosynthesis protein FlhF